MCHVAVSCCWKRVSSDLHIQKTNSSVVQPTARVTVARWIKPRRPEIQATFEAAWWHQLAQLRRYIVIKVLHQEGPHMVHEWQLARAQHVSLREFVLDNAGSTQHHTKYIDAENQLQTNTANRTMPYRVCILAHDFHIDHYLCITLPTWILPNSSKLARRRADKNDKACNYRPPFVTEYR